MKKILYAFLTLMLACSCSDLLERPALTKVADDGFWRGEGDIRLYINAYYPLYFEGYGKDYDQSWAPVRGGTGFSDDFIKENKQSNFTNKVPESLGSSSESRSCSSEYYGPTWGFARIRKTNILIDRLQTVAKANLTDEAYAHWLSVAYFFKVYEYSDLVNVYGAVPYFETTVRDDDKDTQYKDRDSRQLVMDKMYELSEYILENMRTDDGANNMNRYIAAGYISRFFLNEGTWQYYHAGEPSLNGGQSDCDEEHAKKYLQLAVRAAGVVMESGKYSFGSSYNALFSSFDLSSNPEVLFYRHYDEALSITHCIGSYCDGAESQTGVNLEFIKAYLCNDGKPMYISSSTDKNDPTELSLAKVTRSRDSRFFETFYDRADKNSSSLIYCYKFCDRSALDSYFDNGGVIAPEWRGKYNYNDCPLMRLGEVVLNWIEAKAVLAEMGEAAITQDDLDKSINAIRDRPLSAAAAAAGVVKTAHLQIGSVPVDPKKDSDVSALMWEIRRERRMELFHEGNRIKDLRRWYKLDYMDYDTNPDKYLGPWINLDTEAHDFMVAKTNLAKVQHADGSISCYNGSNADEMEGFYCIINAVNRESFFDRAYLAPIGQQQINDYKERGYKLTQTINW